jgi:hypothetical protein
MAATAYLATSLTTAVGRITAWGRHVAAPLCETATFISDGAGFLQRLVSTLLIDRLETARRDANTNKLLQLRHPNTLTPQIWRENARHHFGDVPAYATFFLGQTAPVNHAASYRSGSCDMTNLHVAKKPRNLRSLNLEVKRFIHKGTRTWGATAGRTGRSAIHANRGLSVAVERAIARSGQS